MQDVQYHQNQRISDRYIVWGQLNGDNNKVDNEEYCVTGDNPPVYAGSLVRQEIETALDNQLWKSCLLHNRWDTDIGNTEEDRIHDNKALSGGVGEGK